MTESCIVCQRCSSECQLFRSPNNPDSLLSWKRIIGTEKNIFFVCIFHFDEKSTERVLKTSAVPSVLLAPASENSPTCSCCYNSLNDAVDKYQTDMKLKEIIFKLLEFKVDLSSWICGECCEKIQTFAVFQLEVQEKRRIFGNSLIKQEPSPLASPEFAEILITPSFDPFATESLVKEDYSHGEKLKSVSELNIEKASSQSVSVVDSEPEIVMCLDCGVHFSPDNLILHRVKEHLQEFICDICFKAYQTKAALSRHIRRHIPDDEKQNCDYCSKIFVSRKELITHNNRCHSNEVSFVCDHCENSFLTKKQMLRCRDSHYLPKKSEEHLKPCPICQKMMKSNSIYSHIRLVHNKERDQICQVCGKALKTNYDLKVHLRTHSGERPEICETCGKTFISYAQLYKHRKIRHMIRENFQCSICLKNLLSRFKLKCHTKRFHPDGFDNGIRVDLKTNCYHCKICPLKFIAMHKYEKHLKLNDCHKYDELTTFGDEKMSKGEFKCQECGSVLNTMKGLKKHIRFVHPKEPQSCTICSKQLKNPHTLWQHMTLSHQQPVKKRKT